VFVQKVINQLLALSTIVSRREMVLGAVYVEAHTGCALRVVEVNTLEPLLKTLTPRERLI
jgi:hypothetical protein